MKTRNVFYLFIIFVFCFIKLKSQPVLHEIKYNSTDSTIKLYPDSLNKNEFWYFNQNLGIRFKYFEEFYNPMSSSSESSHDISKWNIYKSTKYGLEFIYPDKLEINYTLTEDGESISDSTIQLGYYYQKHDIEWDYNTPLDSTDEGEYKTLRDTTYTDYTPVIKIFLTNNTFKEIAEKEDFGIDSSAEENKKIRWISYGHQFKNEASFLDGFIWKGLRGESFTGLYHSGGGYIFSVPCTKIFLTKEINNGYKMVITYYEGPSGTAEDETKYILNENDYYNIVNSIKMIN